VAAGAALEELEPRDEHPPAAVVVVVALGRARGRRGRINNPHRGLPEHRGQLLLPRRRLDDETEPDELRVAGGRRHCRWRRGRGTGAHSLLEAEETWRSWDHYSACARLALIYTSGLGLSCVVCTRRRKVFRGRKRTREQCPLVRCSSCTAGEGRGMRCAHLYYCRAHCSCCGHTHTQTRVLLAHVCGVVDSGHSFKV
jgi:hypothetical protein